MQSLPNLVLSKEEVNGLLIRRMAEGGESYICKGPTPNSLFKLFIDTTKEKEPRTWYKAFGIPEYTDIDEMSDNKFEKIKILYQLQLDYSVHPLRTVSMDGKLIGYEMTRDPKFKRLDPCRLNKKELLQALTESKKALEYFATHDITFGDVYDRNILLNCQTGQIRFCDMDNIRLGELSFDLLEQELDRYLEVRSIKYADAYMHSLMTMKIFGLEPQMCILDKYYFKQVFDEQAEPILESLIDLPQYNGEYIVQYVKK